MPQELKKASCPECGEKKKWTWQGWTWRKDKEKGKSVQDVHQRRCACGHLYGVIDTEGYEKRNEVEVEQ